MDARWKAAYQIPAFTGMTRMGAPAPHLLWCRCRYGCAMEGSLLDSRLHGNDVDGRALRPLCAAVQVFLWMGVGRQTTRFPPSRE